MDLNIHNTTNAIDGHFADLKNKLSNHNGLLQWDKFFVFTQINFLKNSITNLTNSISILGNVKLDLNNDHSGMFKQFFKTIILLSEKHITN